ncbi:MAG TPA: allantoinase AllB [Candidatus Dormibacteraeota bacterium]|nr:allantoinase AllB [Candidatus Dormibacteraeota bacterium]
MIVRGGTVVTSQETFQADIAISDGMITEVGRDLAEQGDEIDARGLYVLPGGIDSHVHFNEPGRTDWEDIAHGSAALAAGGYTCFIDMPLNNLPVTTTVEAFDLKLGAMQRSAKIDFGLWAGLVPGNLDELAPLVRRGAMGFKAFMCPSGIDEFPMCDEPTLREGMDRIAELDSIVLVHAEDPLMLGQPAGPTAHEFVESRPGEAEVSAITKAIAIARETGCRLHIVHLSTAAGADVVAKAVTEGIDVSAETCPHYMLYTEADLDRLGGLGKCAPPLRSDRDRERMWRIAMVVSDHSPSSPDLKRGDDFRTIWGGISGCQSTRQLIAERHGPEGVAYTTSIRPANRFGLGQKGDVAAGMDADLWIVDPQWEGVVRREDLLYKNPFSAHEGQRITCRTVRTLVRGRDSGHGQFVRPSRRRSRG